MGADAHARHLSQEIEDVEMKMIVLDRRKCLRCEEFSKDDLNSAL